MVLSRPKLGRGIVYPKAAAMQLAKETNMPVLYTEVELPLEVETPTLR